MAVNRPLTPLEQAHEQLVMTQARLQQMENLLYSRATVTVNEVIDGLTALTNAARQGNQQARQVLGQLTDLLDESRRLAGGAKIVVAQGLPNGKLP